MKRTVLMMLLCLITMTAQAQGGGGYRPASMYEEYVSGNATLFYGAFLPSGSQNDFIRNQTGQAFGLGLEAVFPKTFSVGLRTGYQYRSERLPRQIYQLESGAISAVQTRTLSVVPVLATGSVYFTGVNAPIRPYIQAGAGGAVVNYSKYWGTLVDREQAIRLAIAPAAGVRFRFGGPEGRLGAELQAQYQQVFFNYNELSDIKNLLVSAGLSFRWY